MRWPKRWKVSLVNQQIETLIDGRPFSWAVQGEFSWGSGGPLCQVESDPLLPMLGAQGYRVIDLPPGTADRIKRSALDEYLAR